MDPGFGNSSARTAPISGAKRLRPQLTLNAGALVVRRRPKSTGDGRRAHFGTHESPESAEQSQPNSRLVSSTRTWGSSPDDRIGIGPELFGPWHLLTQTRRSRRRGKATPATTKVHELAAFAERRLPTRACVSRETPLTGLARSSPNTAVIGDRN